MGRYEDACTDRVAFEVYGRKVQTLDLRRLIEVKRAAGRKKDVEAIVELENLFGGGRAA